MGTRVLGPPRLVPSERSQRAPGHRPALLLSHDEESALRPNLRIRPDRATFDALARDWAVVPVWAELLADVSTPVGLFPAVAGDGPGIVLESVERSERWGRYSFVAGDPAADRRRSTPTACGSATWFASCRWRASRRRRRAMRSPRSRVVARPAPARAPALTGGLMGYLAYEAATLLDGHPAPHAGDAPCPPIGLLRDRPCGGVRPLAAAAAPGRARSRAGLRRGVARARGARRPVAAAAPPPLAPRRPTRRGDGDGEHGRRAVPRDRRSFKEHILAGDIFQGVPSRRVSFPAADGRFPDLPASARVEPRAVHVLRADARAWSSPAPRRSRSSASRAGACSTRPIAGTRPRGQTEVRDRLLEHELLADPKEQAEHAMLVDLARNDLGRVCVAGSVRPTELMLVERFSKVMHIVSHRRGRARPRIAIRWTRSRSRSPPAR